MYLQSVLKVAVRLVLGLPGCASINYCTAQLITLAQLSTASDIQTILAHVQVSAKAIASTGVPDRLCVGLTSTVLGQSRLQSADDNQLVVPRTLTSTFGPGAFSTSGLAAWNTLSSELYATHPSHSTVLGIH